MENELSLKNPYLTDNEFLYHLGLSTNDRFVERFQDLKVSLPTTKTMSSVCGVQSCDSRQRGGVGWSVVCG